MAACKRFWGSRIIISGAIVGGVSVGRVADAAEPGATPAVPGAVAPVAAAPSAPVAAGPNPGGASGGTVSAAPSESAGATWTSSSSADATVDAANAGRGPASAREFTPGFEGGLRLGVGLPVGKAGHGLDGSSRSVGDLAPWRAPIWIDVGYRASPTLSYGAYGQFGVGSSGSACAGRCNWSDLRLGAEFGIRLTPEQSSSPWLGIGVGYEWLSAKSLSSVGTADVSGGVPFASTELLGGPELGLQAGLDFRVDDGLRIGPYASASFGDYLGDSYKCEPAGLPCPSGSSINGSGVHAWLGVGVRGSYSP